MVSLIGLTLKFYETCEWSCLQSIGLKRKLLSTCGLELKQEWYRPVPRLVQGGAYNCTYSTAPRPPEKYLPRHHWQPMFEWANQTLTCSNISIIEMW